MSGFGKLFYDDVELASCTMAHPEDAHLGIVLFFIAKGDLGEFVVWDVNKQYQNGGRFNGSYYPVIMSLPNDKSIFTEDDYSDATQKAKLDAYKEYHRRVSNMLARVGADVKRVD